jgi:alkaline phosphatase
MVEGSQVDWACHANDPAHLLSDLLAFDDAVGAALDFAREDKSTMVLAFSDHNTGGFSIGNYASDGIYSQMQVEPFLDPFRKMKASAATLWSRIGDEKTSAKVKETVSREWGMDITEEDAQRIMSLASKYEGNGDYALGEILSAKYTSVGWTTHGHCGGDVPLFAYGPGKPQGLLDGPDIATVCARALGLNLARLNDRLFVDPEKAIPGAIVTVNKVDPNNPVVKIEYRGKWAELPVNKNILRMDSREIPLEGIVVYAPKTGMVYLPMQAVRLITGTSKPLPSVLR